MRKKVNQIRAGVTLTYFATAINIIFSAFYTPIMLRIIGQSEHGLISDVSAVISWITLIGLNLGSSYIRYFARYTKNNDQEKLARLNGFFLMMFSIIGLATLILGVLLSFNLRLVFGQGLTEEQYKTATILALIISVDLAIAFPASVFGSILVSREKFIQNICINIFQNVFTPLLSLTLLFLGKGSIGLVLATTIIDATAYTIRAFYCIKVEKAKFIFKVPEKGFFKDAFNFSIFLTINSIIGQLAGTIDQTIITRYMNTAAVSIYAIGGSLYHYFEAFSSPISAVFTPRVFKIVTENEGNKNVLSKKQTELFVKLGRLKMYLLLLMFSGIVVFGKEFVGFWAGDNYYKSYIIAVILAFSGIVPISQNIGFQIQRAHNKHNVRTLIYTIMTFCNIALTIWLTKYYYEIGATIATAISVIIFDIIVINVYYNNHLQLKMGEYWKSIGKMIFGLMPAFIVGAAIKIFVPINTIYFLIIFIAIYTAIYCVDAWFLCCNPYEKELFGGKIKSILAKFKKKKAAKALSNTEVSIDSENAEVEEANETSQSEE